MDSLLPSYLGLNTSARLLPQFLSYVYGFSAASMYNVDPAAERSIYEFRNAVAPARVAPSEADEHETSLKVDFMRISNSNLHAESYYDTRALIF